MIIALPYCAKDYELAERNLNWCLKMGDPVEFKAVICRELNYKQESIHRLAEEYFLKGVEVFQYDDYLGELSWPHPQNFVFRRFANYMDLACPTQEPWFWWEADCTPLKPTWLTDIATEYVRGGRPFMGNIVDGMGHMNGVGVYPPDAPAYSANMMRSRDVPFDVAASSDMNVPTMVHPVNNLMQHVWEIAESPPTFRSKPDVESLIKPTAVTFHRCKDGSLSEVLGGNKVLRKIKSIISPKEKKHTACVVQLGRYGDIISLLPAIEQLSKYHGEKITVLVGKEFADLLDGVSYAEAEVWSGEWVDYAMAVDYAKSEYRTVYTPGVYGRDLEVTQSTESFCTEAWRLMGMLPQFNKYTKLTLNQRNRRREKKLVKGLKGKNRLLPLIMVNFGGLSSPVPNADKLLLDLETRFGLHATIVDISQVKADKIYDMAGVMDDAKIVITGDTATLHLCAATKTPSIQLISDIKSLWHGSKPKGNCLFHCRYKEIPYQWTEICATIQRKLRHIPSKTAHVYSNWVPNNGDARRYRVARKSWTNVYFSGVESLGVNDQELLRIFDDGDRKLPYVRDMIDFAVDQGYESILLTNGDSGISPKIQEIDLEEGFLYSGRRDFPDKIPIPLTKEQINEGKVYPGTDLWLFSAEWWRKRRTQMPDMLLASEGWDAVLRDLMLRDGAEARDDLVFHEEHENHWEHGPQRQKRRSQQHNLRLSKQYFLVNQDNPQKYGLQ